MAKITQSDPKAFLLLSEALGDLDGVVGKAGWFQGNNYEDGTPVAYVAAIQEFGAVINHPGGTPYKIDPDGKAMFVSKANGSGLPVTKPHTIVIPPRPFMRPTIEREKTKWFKNLADGASLVLKGKANASQILKTVANEAALAVAQTISQIKAPALASGTIAARRNSKSNKKKVGSLDKPLVDSGIMIDTIEGRVENE